MDYYIKVKRYIEEAARTFTGTNGRPPVLVIDAMGVVQDSYQTEFSRCLNLEIGDIFDEAAIDYLSRVKDRYGNPIEISCPESGTTTHRRSIPTH
ncbi:hypothetical protein PPL_09601 [Heterostelium album PN500]|uniref:Uncharacterized protein n=1 Tax=Heterostelium pallidum (strain ATCC 26659 / Pp 5 / PN500) TaxID=670386 RepID=D3BNT0_HETP5|nr:hypothetical protein PPL_09601 [Heterostelium album PN500]EFA76849.1 hypothetical protein PPL_09601 [Heterostelium album PN500]|eukprot:XP_020428981.1 hypothetical protein PPL_09601 [Heterostelium album PN500]